MRGGWVGSDEALPLRLWWSLLRQRRGSVASLRFSPPSASSGPSDRGEGRAAAAAESYSQVIVMMKSIEAEEQMSSWLFKQLKLHLDQEWKYQPREKGLSLIECTTEVKPKHLSCIGVCCFQLAAQQVEEEGNIPSLHDVIRISQCKCTVSDLKRMEKIISEKLHFDFKATTALTFLHLYHTIVLCHTSERKELLNLDKLEAQLKACNCRLVFSKAKPSILALCLLSLEVQTLKSMELFEILLCVQKHSKISDSDLLYWRELVSKCLADYASPACCKPDHKKLVWIVSRRTAQNLQNSYYSVPELPTIPEAGCFDESESEDSCEDMSCGEDSLSSSPSSDGEGAFFFDLKPKSKWQALSFDSMC
ncbi:cyclin-G2 [Protobothrops mucrosquamatus]|uniref:cyclin-G2 n=1 Tax=Protobothrops mucrosquamatus TaxID=103944 RepID=UPI0010FB5B5C|nr:cyclin-G2 [Protobothrops mucrosquamatus]